MHGRRIPRTRIGLLVGGLLVVAVLRLLARDPSRVEGVYADGAGPAIARWIAPASSLVPWSVAETLVVVGVVAIAVLGLRGVRRARRRPGAWPGIVLRGLLNVAMLASLTAATFYLFWGLNYFRPPLEQRLGWSGWAPGRSMPVTAAELTRLCVELVDTANAVRERVDGDPRDGWRARRWDRAIEQGFARVAVQLGLPDGPSARAKPLVSSPIWSRLGIAGIYVPWTAEASYNRELPWSLLPAAIAHEKAHLRGVAAEDEAGFVGLVASIASADPDVQYAAWLDAQLRLLAELRRLDADAAERLRSRRSPAVRADVEEVRRFWLAHRGPVQRIGERANDSYLRLQGVDDGTGSYSRASRLLIAWARRADGSFHEALTR